MEGDWLVDWRGAGGRGGCNSLSVSKLMCFVHPRLEEILKFSPFGPLKSCREGYSASCGYTSRKVGRTVVWGPDRLLHGGGGQI